MKNKGKIYVLLAAVLGIWGTIGYKIVNGLNPDEPQMLQDDFKVSFKAENEIETDTFSVMPIERDPFLGTLTRKAKKNKGNAAIRPSGIPNPNIKITYGGIVKQQNGSNKVFVVNINDKQYLLKPGQTADSVRLINGDAKKIVVRYHNKTQTLKRQ